jgi:O-antigen/teichoic acid export membrane protein
MIGLGGLTAAEMAFGLVGAVLLARELGVEGLGIYSLAMATAGLAAIPVELGLPALVVREIAHAGAALPLQRGVLLFAASFIGVTSALLAAVAIAASGPLAWLMPEQASLHAMLPLVVALIPAVAAGNLCGAALAGRRRVVLGAIPTRLVRPGAFVLLLGISVAAAPEWLTPPRAVLLQVAAAGAALAMGSILVLREFAGALRLGPAEIVWRRWLAAVLRLGIGSGVIGAQRQILLVLTGALSSVEEVGLLRIAQRGASLVLAGVYVAVSPVAPRIAALSAEGRRAEAQPLLTSAAQAGFTIAIAGLAGFLIAGHWLLGALFGHDFATAWAALIVLTVGHAAHALFGPAGTVLNMLRREAVTLRGLALSLVLSAGGAAVLVGPLGALGTALAATAGIAGMSIFLWRQTWREVGLDSAITGRLAAGRAARHRGRHVRDGE